MATNAALYRHLVGVIFVLALGVRFYFQGKFKNVQREGGRGKRRDKFYYYLVLISYLLILVYWLSPWLDFAQLQVPALVRIAGLVLSLAASAVFVWCHVALDKNWSGILELSKDHAIVTTGPYRRVRHPMYSSLFGTSLGFGLLSANWVILVSGVVSVTLMYLARVRDEEAMMLERFGDAYREYMDATGRLLPKPGRSASPAGPRN